MAQAEVMTHVTSRFEIYGILTAVITPNCLRTLGLSDALETTSARVVGRSHPWFRPLVRTNCRAFRDSYRACSARLDIPRKFPLAAWSGRFVRHICLSSHIAAAENAGNSLGPSAPGTCFVGLLHHAEVFARTISDFSREQLYCSLAAASRGPSPISFCTGFKESITN